MSGGTLKMSYFWDVQENMIWVVVFGWADPCDLAGVLLSLLGFWGCWEMLFMGPKMTVWRGCRTYVGGGAAL